MPASTATPNWAWPAEVIGSTVSAASISTLSLVTVVPLLLKRDCRGRSGYCEGAFGGDTRPSGPARSSSAATARAVISSGVPETFDRDTRLVRLERLEGGELGVEQRRRHEVALPVRHPFLDERPVTGEMHEDDVGCGGPQPVPVRPLQRRAADHPAEPGPAVRPLADGVQPRPAVVVGQRGPGRHLGDVGRGVEVVGLGVRNAQPSREQGTDGGLARCPRRP